MVDVLYKFHLISSIFIKQCRIWKYIRFNFYYLSIKCTLFMFTFLSHIQLIFPQNTIRFIQNVTNYESSTKIILIQQNWLVSWIHKVQQMPKGKRKQLSQEFNSSVLLNKHNDIEAIMFSNMDAAYHNITKWKL